MRFPNEYPQVQIYMPSILAVFTKHLGEQSIEQIAFDFRYPDGSREFGSAESIAGMVELAKSAVTAEIFVPHHMRPKDLDLAWGTQYRGQFEQPQKWYSVLLWHPAVRDMEDREQIFMMPYHPDHFGTECPADKVMLTILCRRRLTATQIEILCRCLANFAEAMKSRGIGGEGAVRLVSEAAIVQGNRLTAMFDFSHSSQRSFNWLVLSLLRSLDEVTITAIQTVDDSTLERRFGKPKGKIVRYAF